MTKAIQFKGGFIMDCKYCGQPLKDGARFCTSCGALNDADTTSASSSFPTASKSFDATKKLKNNVSNTKTLFYWISKYVILAALICFIMPFMEIKFCSGYVHLYSIEMSGKELIFGVDDDKSSESSNSKSNLNNEKIIFAVVLAIAALVMNNRNAAITSAVSAILVFAFINGADRDYTLKSDVFKDVDLIFEFKPGVYIVMTLMLVAAALAAFDYYLRVKMAKDETEFY